MHQLHSPDSITRPNVEANHEAGEIAGDSPNSCFHSVISYHHGNGQPDKTTIWVPDVEPCLFSFCTSLDQPVQHKIRDHLVSKSVIPLSISKGHLVEGDSWKSFRIYELSFFLPRRDRHRRNEEASLRKIRTK
ncbi:unnamed protein product [Protopolystoma xenopodis]|uniref:Uncharacterized protein n=1 Tax=Protopolystoma xenopodis TaxID=117903 RepID=A0A448WBG1_9PLAT|nr:unnamed protein product [Protopolystoma xenopodis]